MAGKTQLLLKSDLVKRKLDNNKQILDLTSTAGDQWSRHNRKNNMPRYGIHFKKITQGKKLFANMSQWLWHCPCYWKKQSENHVFLIF